MSEPTPESTAFDPGKLLGTYTVPSDHPARKAKGITYRVTIYERGGVCQCRDYMIVGVNSGKAYSYQCKHITRVRSTMPPPGIAEVTPVTVEKAGDGYVARPLDHLDLFKQGRRSGR